VRPKQNAYCQCEASIINCAYQYRCCCTHRTRTKAKTWLRAWPDSVLAPSTTAATTATAHWDKPVRLYAFGFCINHGYAKCYVSNICDEEITRKGSSMWRESILFWFPMNFYDDETNCGRIKWIDKYLESRQRVNEIWKFCFIFLNIIHLFY